jgi:hypothetical protein
MRNVVERLMNRWVRHGILKALFDALGCMANLIVVLASTIVAALLVWHYRKVLEDFNGLIVATATVVLVLVTARYVALTARLVARQDETARLERSPLLYFSLNPTLLEAGEWKLAFALSNYGLGPAICLRGDISVAPLTTRKDSNWHWKPVDLGFHTDSVPPTGNLLGDIRMVFLDDSGNVPETLRHDLRVRLWFEDAIRNAYCYLIVFSWPLPSTKYLRRDNEALWFQPLAERSSTSTAFPEEDSARDPEWEFGLVRLR